jgi:hypothetical protein
MEGDADKEFCPVFWRAVGDKPISKSAASATAAMENSYAAFFSQDFYRGLHNLSQRGTAALWSKNVKRRIETW